MVINAPRKTIDKKIKPTIHLKGNIHYKYNIIFGITKLQIIPYLHFTT